MYVVIKHGYGYSSLMGLFSDAAAIERTFNTVQTSIDEYGELSFWAMGGGFYTAIPVKLDEEVGEYGNPPDGYGRELASWSMDD